jgi:hypothetical protein
MQRSIAVAFVRSSDILLGYGNLPVVPPWFPADHGGHHPGVGDDPYCTPLQAGVRPASHRPGSPPPRDICLRRRPRQREPRGDVRAVAVFFTPLRLAIPFDIALPRSTGRPEAAAPSHPCHDSVPPPHPPVQTAPCRATPCGAPPGSEPRPPATAACGGRRERRARRGRRQATRGGLAGVVGGCAPEGAARKCRLNYLYTVVQTLDDFTNRAKARLIAAGKQPADVTDIRGLMVDVSASAQQLGSLVAERDACLRSPAWEQRQAQLIQRLDRIETEGKDVLAFTLHQAFVYGLLLLLGLLITLVLAGCLLIQYASRRLPRASAAPGTHRS